MNAQLASAVPREALLVSAGLILSAALIAGCALHPAPIGELAAARATLDIAVLAGEGGPAAGEIPLARNKIALGERWIAAGDNGPALWLVEQAQVDAELAVMKAASARARSAAAAATREFRAFNALATGTN